MVNYRELRLHTFSAIKYLSADLTISGATKESSITLHRESALTGII